MAARGTSSKETITKKILEVFPGSFLYNGGKEIRIPMTEAGEILQVKVSLTCAKTNVESGQDTAVPGETGATPSIAASVNEPVAPSAEEKKAVKDLLSKLGL